ESGTSVGRSRGLRFRGCGSALRTEAFYSLCSLFLFENKRGFPIPFAPNGSNGIVVVMPAFGEIESR
ncbi:MAG: hypothetical protein K2H04_05200, partial [Bacteroidaceae bacterium]|nr:hypothetical protein [Bacteroidaceae bacterium]